MSDYQRQKVYNAEFMLRRVLENAGEQETRTFDFHGSTLLLPEERRFACLDSLQSYVDRVLALNWVSATWSPGPVRVRARKGQTKAHYQCGEIAVPLGNRWALREIVVLHEIAHHLAPGGHGPSFAGTHWALINEIIGPEIGLVYSWCQDVNSVERAFKKIRVSA